MAQHDQQAQQQEGQQPNPLQLLGRALTDIRKVQNLLEQDSTTQVRAMLALADRSGVPAIATNGVRYLVPGDA